MKTEKIEIWVPYKIAERTLKRDFPKNDIIQFQWRPQPRGDFQYKVTLEIEMPERKGTFTEVELINFRTSSHILEVALDKLFNGEFKDGD